MNEDNVCEVTLVLTPQGDYTLAGIDDYLNEVGDMGDAASRRKRRTERKKKRYSKASKSTRKAAIAARVATRMAIRAGKVKKGRVSKAARNARRAARKGSSVLASVVAGLMAVGLSKKTATAYAKRAIALLSGKKSKSKGKSKGKSTAKPTADEKLVAAATNEENAAEASGETEEDEAEDEGEGEDDLEGEDAEFDEEYDSGPGGTEVAGYGAIPTIDRVKPFIPWIVLGVGALAIWKFSASDAPAADKAPARKKR
jgi:hypothetical protein